MERSSGLGFSRSTEGGVYSDNAPGYIAVAFGAVTFGGVTFGPSRLGPSQFDRYRTRAPCAVLARTFPTRPYQPSGRRDAWERRKTRSIRGQRSVARFLSARAATSLSLQPSHRYGGQRFP